VISARISSIVALSLAVTGLGVVNSSTGCLDFIALLSRNCAPRRQAAGRASTRTRPLLSQLPRVPRLPQDEDDVEPDLRPEPAAAALRADRADRPLQPCLPDVPGPRAGRRRRRAVVRALPRAARPDAHARDAASAGAGRADAAS